MDRLARVKAYALQKLIESKEDGWSFLHEIPGTEHIPYYRWRYLDDEEWDGDTIWLRGHVSEERLRQLSVPNTALTKNEKAIWRLNLAYWYASQPDFTSYAIIIPVSLDGKIIDGYAVFVVGQGHPSGTPGLEGVFASREEAMRVLDERGAMVSEDPWFGRKGRRTLQ